MLNFKQYYWLNSKHFLIFSITSVLVFTILLGLDALLLWGGLVSFLNILNLIGEYVTYKKYKKRNPND